MNDKQLARLGRCRELAASRGRLDLVARSLEAALTEPDPARRHQRIVRAIHDIETTIDLLGNA